MQINNTEETDKYPGILCTLQACSPCSQIFSRTATSPEILPGTGGVALEQPPEPDT